MSTNLSFDPSDFNVLVKKFGIKDAWKNLLFTYIQSKGEDFAYILKDKVFAKSTTLEKNLLEGLSIGKISVLYEYCVAYVDAKSRKDNGQFYTPDDVANLMVRHALLFPKGKWLDPCSGIGNLSWHLVQAQKDKESFLINQMILSDRDDLALFIARIIFTLSFQKKNKNLYYEIEKCFVRFDFLSVADNTGVKSNIKVALREIPKHDYVIVNPPYLGLKGEDNRFETSKSRDLYAYFLENIIKTSKGFVSITPQSFTNAKKFTELRSLLLDNYPMLKIYAFDNIPGNIFYGVKFGSSNSNTSNSIRAAITIAGSGGTERKITSLLRWRTSERETLFLRLDDFLSSSTLTSEYFPKVSSVFHTLYKSLISKKKLGSIVSNTPTDYCLYIPSSPRYFICALKKPVSRASIKVVYFKSEDDMNKAYLLINSSIMYWWWRVRDGGMTLSLETLKSLPLLDFRLDNTLIKKLENSEITNRVYKMNAGAIQENVKHDTELINQINKLILPKYAKQLILTHKNSELLQIIVKKNSGTA